MGFENTFFGFNNHSASIFGKILPTIGVEAIATWAIMAEKIQLSRGIISTIRTA